VIAVLISGALAMVIALAGTPLVIAYFRGHGLSQSIRDDVLIDHAATKAGTPTMGGTAIVLAAVIGFAVAHVTELRFTPAGWLVVFVFVGMAGVGFLDDYIKVRMRRSLGLTKTAKFLGQATVALVFAWAGPVYADVPRNISLVGELNLATDLPVWAYAVWVFIVLAGFSNAVNLTDGLDGLAAGSSTLVLGAYTLIGFWMFRNPSSYAFIGSQESLDVAVVAAAGLAACAGFLWFNAPPARIYMGDTGSLALGGLLAALAMVTNTQLLLVVLGGLFVLETSSVMAQVVAFRAFGQRVLRMAPIHHHFELLGWAETTVVVRFWIIAGLGVTVGLGLFYAEWIGRVGVTP
jgi:phospho-N-acetylmuramoyl-pentapeptide-transferase